jgi:hypothetical protein
LLQEKKPDEERNIQFLATTLEDLKKKGKYLDIQICPKCKSPRVRRVGSMEGDMSGQMSLTLPKFECLDCGWRGRLNLVATNRPVSKKQIGLITEAFDQEKNKMGDSRRA